MSSNAMKGKVVVITGANAGIGRATAEALAGMGARVFACGRDAARLDEAVAPTYLASSPDVADVTGAYFADCKQTAPSKLAQDDALAAKLWSESERLLSEI